MKRMRAFTKGILNNYVLENTELQLPHSIEEGLSMYKELLEIANI